MEEITNEMQEMLKKMVEMKKSECKHEWFPLQIFMTQDKSKNQEFYCKYCLQTKSIVLLKGGKW